MTKTKRERVASVYQAGATTRETAAKVGVGEDTVRRWLHEDGVELRPRGPRELPVTDDEIRELVGRGWNWVEIADAVGMSRSGVRGRWRAMTGEGRWR